MSRTQAIPVMNGQGRKQAMAGCDPVLLTASAFLALIGLVMVASSSVSIADNSFGEPLHYFWRQVISMIIGLGGAAVILTTPLSIWEKLSVPALIVALAFLIAVLIPGVGREVNGGMRWINVGPVNIQSSEIAKICLVLYLAGYMVRQQEKLRTTFSGFFHPIVVLTIVSALLLLEPDFGSTVVIFATALGMLFMGGIPLGRFFSWGMVALAALASLAVLSPYRLQRLVSFMDPWQDPYNSGFQLSQALIAFGRGDWLGVGLGSSVQKLFYLPEAHTDFVFAVYAEEFGLLGAALLILLYLALVWRALVIGEQAHRNGALFSAYVAYGVGLIIGIQAFINIGVNMGVLPTKGLTLPLVSYGNNSVIISIMLIAFLIRVDIENRQGRRVPQTVRTDLHVD